MATRARSRSAAPTALAPRPAPRVVVMPRKSASVTSSPKFKAIAHRLDRLQQRTRQAAHKNEDMILTFVGAGALPLVSKFTGKPVPTVANIDPNLLYGGLALVASQFVGGKNGERLRALGMGIASPGIANAVKTGKVRMSGEGDEFGADEEMGADVELGADDDI